MAAVVELGRDRKSGRTGAHHRHPLARPAAGRLGHDPALGKCPLHDRELDLLDRHRIVIDRQDAGRLARCRADQAGELGKVVGGV